MNKICPKCKRIGIFRNKENNWQCPWLDCKYIGKEVEEYKKIPNIKNYAKCVTQNAKLSCIIAYTKSPDKNRDKALELLMECFQHQTYKNFELIVVEHVRDNFKEGRFPYRYMVDKHIVLYDDRTFNKSWIMNVGAKVATTNNLLFHDADVLFGNDFLQKVVNFIPKHKLFSCWSSFRCMPGKDNPYLRIHVPKTIHCLIGAWHCQKNYYFYTLGGYNEDYFGYGREDSDIWHRANHLLGNIPYMDYSLVHHYHDWHPKEGPNPLNLEDGRGNLILEKCMKFPEKIRQMLLQVKHKLGNIENPTLIHSETWNGDYNAK